MYSSGCPLLSTHFPNFEVFVRTTLTSQGARPFCCSAGWDVAVQGYLSWDTIRTSSFWRWHRTVHCTACWELSQLQRDVMLGIHRQSETRAGHRRRHTRIKNASPPTQTNYAARAANSKPPTRPLYMHLTRTPRRSLSSVPPIHNWPLPDIELLLCVLSFQLILKCRLAL